ncbi:MAG: hypothetical protein GX323_05895 [Clostridiales bacterium]|nr:hypothetical protein [Clostridiales bacterium]
MLNQDKVRVMTKLAIYREKEGRQDLKINKFFKTDYLRLQMIKAFVCSTLGTLLIVGLTALYHMEYLILNLTQLDFEAIGKYVLLIYLMVSLLYITIAAATASIRYNRATKGLMKYNYLLNKLRKYYAADDVAKE